MQVKKTTTNKITPYPSFSTPSILFYPSSQLFSQDFSQSLPVLVISPSSLFCSSAMWLLTEQLTLLSVVINQSCVWKLNGHPFTIFGKDLPGILNYIITDWNIFCLGSSKSCTFLPSQYHHWLGAVWKIKDQGYVHTILDSFLWRNEKLLICYSMNTYPICDSPL